MNYMGFLAFIDPNFPRLIQNTIIKSKVIKFKKKITEFDLFQINLDLYILNMQKL